MNKRWIASALAAIGLLQAAPSHAVMHEIVAGSTDSARLEQNGFPFSTLPQAYGYASTRYQQVYSSSLFTDPFAIREILFYPTSNTGAPIVPATIDVYLSTTVAGVNALHGQPFDANLGADTRLFATLIGGFNVDGSQFAIRGTPFIYDPAQGNLLLDIRITGAPAGHSGPFFAALGPGVDATGPISRWHDFGIGFDNRGLVTGFRTWVPEPGTLALLILGIVAIAFVRGRASL